MFPLQKTIYLFPSPLEKVSEGRKRSGLGGGLNLGVITHFVRDIKSITILIKTSLLFIFAQKAEHRCSLPNNYLPIPFSFGEGVRRTDEV